jgi:hypothetical protein
MVLETVRSLGKSTVALLGISTVADSPSSNKRLLDRINFHYIEGSKSCRRTGVPKEPRTPKASDSEEEADRSTRTSELKVRVL